VNYERGKQFHPSTVAYAQATVERTTHRSAGIISDNMVGNNQIIKPNCWLYHTPLSPSASSRHLAQPSIAIGCCHHHLTQKQLNGEAGWLPKAIQQTIAAGDQSAPQMSPSRAPEHLSEAPCSPELAGAAGSRSPQSSPSRRPPLASKHPSAEARAPAPNPPSPPGGGDRLYPSQQTPPSERACSPGRRGLSLEKLPT